MHVLLGYKIRAFKNIWRHLCFPSRMKNYKICCKLVAKYCSSTLHLGRRIMTAFTFEWQERGYGYMFLWSFITKRIVNTCFYGYRGSFLNTHLAYWTTNIFYVMWLNVGFLIFMFSNVKCSSENFLSIMCHRRYEVSLLQIV